MDLTGTAPLASLEGSEEALEAVNILSLHWGKRLNGLAQGRTAFSAHVVHLLPVSPRPRDAVFWP